MTFFSPDSEEFAVDGVRLAPVCCSSAAFVVVVTAAAVACTAVAGVAVAAVDAFVVK